MAAKATERASIDFMVECVVGLSKKVGWEDRAQTRTITDSSSSDYAMDMSRWTTAVDNGEGSEERSQAVDRSIGSFVLFNSRYPRDFKEDSTIVQRWAGRNTVGRSQECRRP
jgi:hypothetical protein